MFVSERAQPKTNKLKMHNERSPVKSFYEASKMVQGVKKITAKPDNLSSIPRIHKVGENHLQVVP